MEVTYGELKAVLHDAESFISITLVKETLSRETENQRQQLATKLTNIKNRTDHEVPTHPEPFPPRPPKPAEGYNVVEADNQQQDDIYDDLAVDDTNESDAERVGDTQHDEIPGEDYEDMEDKEQRPEQKPVGDEDYDVAQIEETYEEPGQEPEEYEEPVVTKPQPFDISDATAAQKEPSEELEDDMYDGIDLSVTSDINIDEKIPKPVGQRIQEGSVTNELEDLTKTVKSSEVKNVLFKGYLNKHRKKKVFIGSRWQRRYCIVRDFAMYYYKDETSEKQKGTIILPGYIVTLKQDKVSKGFTLTRDSNDRTYTFLADNKEEAEKWVEAITTGCGSQLSCRQSKILDDLRKKAHEGDEDSLTYDDLANNGKQKGTDETPETAPGEEGEMYDDLATTETTEDDPDLQEYEIPDVNPSNAPKPAAAEPVSFADEVYEVPGDESAETAPPAQPPRPPKTAPIQEDEYEMPGDSPVHSAEVAVQPVSEDFYETPEEQTPPLPPAVQPPRPPMAAPQKPSVEEEYEIPGEEPEPARPPRPIKDRQPEPVFEDEDMYDVVETEKTPQPSAPTQDAEYEIAEVSNTSPRPGSKALISHPAPAPPPRIIPVAIEMPLSPFPGQEKGQGKPPPPQRNISKPNIPPKPQESPSRSLDKGSPPPPPREPHSGKAPLPTPVPAASGPPEDQVINYANIYQALWDVKVDDVDELEFKRGDLIYIYDKPHSDWWIGSTYKPQGYATKLVPKNYLMEAFNL